jgi:hypothetical protein
MPRATEYLSFEDKRSLLQAPHVKATAKPDGDSLINAEITEDLLALLVPTDSSIMVHDLYSDRGRDRRGEDGSHPLAGRAVRDAYILRAL